MNHRVLRAALVLAAVLAIAFAGQVSAAPSAQSGQCPGATTIGNTATSDGTIVLPAGLSVCIHAGNGNTGTFVTDGTSTLAEYIEASGLLNDGGQVPTVSNYVVYEETPSATPEPSSQPSSEPSSEPTPSPTTSPSATPVPTPSPTSGGPTPAPRVTLPPTDAASAQADHGGSNVAVFFALSVLVATLAMLLLLPRRMRR